MASKYTKWPQNIPNGHTIYPNLPFQVPPKFAQTKIFGFKICHLATLVERRKTRLEQQYRFLIGAFML
jgi:hypothetical protein